MSTEQANPSAGLAKGRRQLVTLIGLFLLPPLAAWLAWWYIGEHGVAQTTNAGTLIQPARPLPLDPQTGDAKSGLEELKGRWVYVVVAPDQCDQQCVDQLYLTRQTRLAVNKDIQRVKRVLLTGAPLSPARLSQIEDDHPDLLIAEGELERLQEVLDKIPMEASGQEFFLLDPLGNLMMFYSPEVPSKGLLRDLQKLLKISQIG